MNLLRPAVYTAFFLSLITCTVTGTASAVANAAPRVPDAIVDLETMDGLGLLHGEWRYHDAEIITVDHHSPGSDRKPSGPPNKTHDIIPHAGPQDFDDATWQVIDPTTLQDRRATGRLCAAWYRLSLTVPEKLGALDAAGMTAVLEIVADDYAEIWVNGRLPQVLGQVGGPLAAGWNAPNRVVLGRNVKPGERFEIAIFAANAPLSEPPANFVWIRSATMDFYKPGRYTAAESLPARIERLDPAIDEVVPPGATLERLATGFTFTEGPVWVLAGKGPAAFSDEGFLLFSDPNNNVIYRCTRDGQVSVYRTKSGYRGLDIGEYGQPGSNGLTLDSQGRLTICEHGNHRISRLEPNGVLTILADSLDGKRLNSPNDLVYRSDDTLFFTDPPFGLPKFHADPRRELPDTPVFCLYRGQLKRVSSDLAGPNGLAFSPDEKYLYVTNWDTTRKIVMRYEVAENGDLANGSVFLDMKDGRGDEALDGIKVDAKGNLFVSGPGGVWVISPAGQHLGMIVAPELPANFAWGDDDGRTLYMTARTSLYRMRMANPGIRPH